MIILFFLTANTVRAPDAVTGFHRNVDEVPTPCKCQTRLTIEGAARFAEGLSEEERPGLEFHGSAANAVDYGPSGQ